MKQVVNWESFARYGNPIAEPPSEKPSLTVPDMTLSLKELIERYVRTGQAEVFNGVYTGEDTDIPDGFEYLTEQDRMDLARDLNYTIDVSRHELQEKSRLRQEQQKKAVAPAPPSEDVHSEKV